MNQVLRHDAMTDENPHYFLYCSTDCFDAFERSRRASVLSGGYYGRCAKIERRENGNYSCTGAHSKRTSRHVRVWLYMNKIRTGAILLIEV